MDSNINPDLAFDLEAVKAEQALREHLEKWVSPDEAELLLINPIDMTAEKHAEVVAQAFRFARNHIDAINSGEATAEQGIIHDEVLLMLGSFILTADAAQVAQAEQDYSGVAAVLALLRLVDAEMLTIKWTFAPTEDGHMHASCGLAPMPGVPDEVLADILGFDIPTTPTDDAAEG